VLKPIVTESYDQFRAPAWKQYFTLLADPDLSTTGQFDNERPEGFSIHFGLKLFVRHALPGYRRKLIQYCCFLKPIPPAYRENDEAMRGVINSGHKRSMAFVIRVINDKGDTGKFSTWCPKAIAMIGPAKTHNFEPFDSHSIAAKKRGREEGIFGRQTLFGVRKSPKQNFTSGERYSEKDPCMCGG
jgi:hypothetical protein